MFGTTMKQVTRTRQTCCSSCFRRLRKQRVQEQWSSGTRDSTSHDPGILEAKAYLGVLVPCTFRSHIDLKPQNTGNIETLDMGGCNHQDP